MLAGSGGARHRTTRIYFLQGERPHSNERRPEWWPIEPTVKGHMILVVTTPDGLVLTQSKATTRYLARTFGLPAATTLNAT